MGLFWNRGSTWNPLCSVKACSGLSMRVPLIFTISSSLNTLPFRIFLLRRIMPSATNSSTPSPIFLEPVGISVTSRVVQWVCASILLSMWRVTRASMDSLKALLRAVKLSMTSLLDWVSSRWPVIISTSTSRPSSFTVTRSITSSLLHVSSAVRSLPIRAMYSRKLCLPSLRLT